MLLVKDLKAAEGSPLPDNFLNLLPEECDVCGMGMCIQPTLTTLSCINPRCEDKIVARMVAMLEELGVKGIGDEGANAYVHEKKVINPLQILWEPRETNICDSISFNVWSKVAEQISNRNQKGYYLYEIVKMMGIPGVQTSAEKLFESGDLQGVYECLEQDGISWVQNTLGIQAEGTISVRATKIFEQLMLYKEDIYEAVEKLGVKKKNLELPEVTIVCSTAVGAPFKSKKHFTDYVSNMCEGKLNITIGSSVTKKTDYLVWSGADGSPAAITSKVKTAMNRNEKAGEEVVKIVTGTQLVDILKEEIGK